MPAGVHNVQAGEIKPKGKALEEAQAFAMEVRPFARSSKKQVVLAAVLGGVGAHELPWALRMGRCPEKCIILVIAKGDACRARLHHAANKSNRFDLVRPAVNEVTYEYSGAGWVPPCAIALAIAELQEQRLEGFHMTMHIANDVVH
jgi:hypothetical protein